MGVLLLDLLLFLVGVMALQTMKLAVGMKLEYQIGIEISTLIGVGIML